MIVRFKKTTGSIYAISCEHAILHEEKGKDSWLEILGIHNTGASAYIDTSYLIKGLCWWSLWDHGQCLTANQVPLSVRLGRSQ